MKILFIATAGLLFTNASQKVEFMEGDILFQSTGSRQSKAIELATYSKFSHVAMIIEKDGKLMVAEAVQPVKFTSLDNWIKQGNNSKYTQMRLKEADKVLTPAVKQKMRAQAKNYSGKNYDLYFEWSDDKLYCSELVWKIYKQSVGLEVGRIRRFKEYDFSNPLVKKQLKERFGNDVPMDEKIVAPEDIYRASNLVKVN